ncbi:MAG: hypothetical protein MHPSP_001517 [Paramarteilia canceri]
MNQTEIDPRFDKYLTKKELESLENNFKEIIQTQQDKVNELKINEEQILNSLNEKISNLENDISKNKILDSENKEKNFYDVLKDLKQVQNSISKHEEKMSAVLNDQKDIINKSSLEIKQLFSQVENLNKEKNVQRAENIINTSENEYNNENKFEIETVLNARDEKIMEEIGKLEQQISEIHNEINSFENQMSHSSAENEKGKANIEVFWIIIISLFIW